MKKDTASVIILSAQPMGRFEEVIVNDTSSPGTVMELLPDQGPIGGRFTYRHASRVDGGKGPNPILLEDEQQGGLDTTAYTAGRRGRMYWPAAGEEFLMLRRYQPGTGTASDDQIGDLLEVDGATGMLQAVGTGGASGSHASAPFQLREPLDAPITANVLIWVQYLGDNA